MRCFAILISALILSPAFAQTENVLEEVVVVAQKREQTLQEVPIAVSVVEAGLDTINNGTASFTSPRNATYTVTRSPEATGIAWVWFTDGAGNLRADGSLTLREAPG